ncbi:uncharacterized protein NECHADRAFT_56660 [Fusarium vanettenii 77-13-4]|uniref:Carboxylic ester hydrolase n=1 Tax=Fusarium vanettenii (strain ATCC MYA-4622 / CBS 123669 / FGSC 9596 / NRRL 45880 / 77-13-4) TaxID=660122 RepID=C7ZRB6_FUSV7|nr:uncharacterized protein NECHADRAFT_56660 [Fusarium vanettenii 77-13-4]EEU33441.1 hypothetical protein NECHADRAFT_56660 [Fusarium vanettenii 77-13-4]
MALTSLAQACLPTTFSPTVFGVSIVSIQTSLVSNFSAVIPAAYRFAQPTIEVSNATFCNVTVTYTHPGLSDSINVESWLPVQNWNERLLATGGGGWVAGRFQLSYSVMTGAIGEGYATVTTDAGLGISPDPLAWTSAEPWALVSPGNVNLYHLRNFGHLSLKEMTVIGKSLISSFYSEEPKFSYWSGCSQGGRQGLEIAQRYPDLYDGIVAGAPGIYLPQVVSNIYWPQQYMNEIGKYPLPCEFDAITKAAITECDGLDGVADGIISDTEICEKRFNPTKLTGKAIECAQTNSTTSISAEAVKIAKLAWDGISTAEGKSIWHGLNIGADLTATDPAGGGYGTASTKCSNGSCVGNPSELGASWIRLFLAQDRNFQLAKLTRKEFLRLVRLGIHDYSSFIRTSDPDLSGFRDAGGKIITFHGLADNVIPSKGTEQYYKEVAAFSPDARSFTRYYPVPGLDHCFGGTGGQPINLMSQLRAWVENGTAPESSPVTIIDRDGEPQQRVLCPYPQRASLKKHCKDVSNVECWSCVSRPTY